MIRQTPMVTPPGIYGPTSVEFGVVVEAKPPFNWGQKKSFKRGYLPFGDLENRLFYR